MTGLSRRNNRVRYQERKAKEERQAVNMKEKKHDCFGKTADSPCKHPSHDYRANTVEDLKTKTWVEDEGNRAELCRHFFKYDKVPHCIYCNIPFKQWQKEMRKL